MKLNELINKKVAIIDGFGSGDRLVGKLIKIEKEEENGIYYFYTKDNCFPASIDAIDYLIKSCKKEIYYKEGKRKQIVQAGTAYVLDLGRYKNVSYEEYLKSI